MPTVRPKRKQAVPEVSKQDILKDLTVFQGHVGTWYKIAEATYNDKFYELWESEQYGDGANNLITEDGELIIEDSYNGLSVDLGDYLDVDYEEIARYVID
ncbi:hypothetical protein [Bacteroides sp.]|uniref:hypothetical protein n=1 Tax=Bacteroides sp. TaxID=29523 RepID=UPI0026180249|nr:hypothetical protein [Bacteroides sp.]MDD3039777.1 hypothetical protein [Bacteroides sp.]